jgi:hypothetical protein
VVKFRVYSCYIKWYIQLPLGVKCLKNMCTAWVSNPRPAKLYHVARGHIYKLKIYDKNYTIVSAVGCTKFCYFSACGPRTSSQYRVWPFAIKSLDAPGVRYYMKCRTYECQTNRRLVFVYWVFNAVKPTNGSHISGTVTCSMVKSVR